MSALKDELKNHAQSLAKANVFIGTSSWKYAGWCGQIYDKQRYLTRGKFSNAKFEATCLSEYAEVFKSVCVDAGYYKFPDEKYLEKLATAVPEDFKFAFKVTDHITLKNYPNLSRFGAHAGKRNDNFLNADLFRGAFLKPCESFKKNIGVLMFEFSQFHERDFEHGRDFVAALDAFLEQLPTGWQYGVEIRNKNFLVPEYFEMVARHKVAHVYNSWTRMPPVSEQITMEHSQTADFLAARFLLTPGKGYDNAVKSFSPYTETKAVDENARAAGKALIEKAKKLKRLPSYVFINNRLEGNALYTILAMLSIRETETLPQSTTPVKLSTVAYPSFWIARLSVAEPHQIPLMVVHAIFEVTENTARSTYKKEAALFDIGTPDEIREHCTTILTQAAHEFVDGRYGLKRHSPEYQCVISEIEQIASTDVYGINSQRDDYDVFVPDAEQVTGRDVEAEKVFVSSTGVRIWVHEEEHPEQ